MFISILKLILILFFTKVYKTIKKDLFIKLNKLIFLILNINVLKKKTFLRLTYFLGLYL